MLEGNKESFALLRQHVVALVPGARVVEADAKHPESDLKNSRYVMIMECSDRNIMKFIPENEVRYKSLKNMAQLKLLVFHH